MKLAVSLLVLIHIVAARQNKLDRKEGVSVFIYSPPKEARGSGLDTWIKNEQKSLQRLKRPIIRQTLDGRFVKDVVEGILLLTEVDNNEVFVPEELIVSTKKLLTFVQQQLKNNESLLDERNPVRRDTGNSEAKGKPFSFQYIIDDELTQNFQTRQEEGDAMGVVKGCYQLLEPNGMVRTVIYHADSFGFKIISASKGPDKVPCSGSTDEGFQTPFQKTFKQNLGGKALSSSNNNQVGNHQPPKTRQQQKEVPISSKGFVSPTTVASQKEIQTSDITTSQKEDSIVSYINNLSETLFQSFKSVDSKDVSNFVNFPFVLIPISTFFQLRQDGHIDNEVQGFGAVIQNPQGKSIGTPKSLIQNSNIPLETFDKSKSTVFNQNPSLKTNIRGSYRAPGGLQHSRDKIAKSPDTLNQNFNEPSKNSETLNYKEPSKQDMTHLFTDSQPSQSQVANSFSSNLNNFGSSGTKKPSEVRNRLSKSDRKLQRHRNNGNNFAQSSKIAFSSKVAEDANPFPTIEEQTLTQPEIKQHTREEILTINNGGSSYSNYESDELYEDESFDGSTEFTNPKLESSEPQATLTEADLKPTSINGFTVPAISVLPLEYDHESSDLPFHGSVEVFSDSAEISDILDQHAISSVGTQQVVDPNNKYIPPATEMSSFGEKIYPDKINNHHDNIENPSDSLTSSTSIKTQQPQFSAATSVQEIFPPPQISRGEVSGSNSFQLYQTPTQDFQLKGSFAGADQKPTAPKIPMQNNKEIQPYQPVIPKDMPFDFENEQSLSQLYESPVLTTASTTSIDSDPKINNNALASHNTSSFSYSPNLSKQSVIYTEQTPSQLSQINQELQLSLTLPNPGVTQNIKLSELNGDKLSQPPVQGSHSIQVSSANIGNSFQVPKESLTRPLLASNKNFLQNFPKTKESVAEIYLVSPRLSNKQGKFSSNKNATSQDVAQYNLNLNENTRPSQHTIQGSKPTNIKSNSGTSLLSQIQGRHNFNQALQSSLTQLYKTPSQPSTLPNQPLQKKDQSLTATTQRPSHSFNPIKHGSSQTSGNIEPTANVILMKPIIKQLYMVPTAEPQQSSFQNKNEPVQASHSGQFQSTQSNQGLSNINPKEISSYLPTPSTAAPTHLLQTGGQKLQQHNQQFNFNGVNKFTNVQSQNFKLFNQGETRNADNSVSSSVKNKFQGGDPVKSPTRAIQSASQRPSTDYQAPSITKLWPTNQKFQTSQKITNQANNLSINQQPQTFQTFKSAQVHSPKQTHSDQSSPQSQTPSMQSIQMDSLGPKAYRAPKQSQIHSFQEPKQEFKQSSQAFNLNNPSFKTFNQRPDKNQASQNHEQIVTQTIPALNKLNYNQPFETSKQNLPQQIKTVGQVAKSSQAQLVVTPKQSPHHYQRAVQNNPQQPQTRSHNFKPNKAQSFPVRQQNPSQAYSSHNQIPLQASVASQQNHVQLNRLPGRIHSQNLNQNENAQRSLPTLKQIPFVPRRQSPNEAPKHRQAQFNQNPDQTSSMAYKQLDTGEMYRNKPSKPSIPNPNVQGRDKKLSKNFSDQFPEFGLKISNSGSNLQQSSSYSSIPKATSKNMNGWSPMTTGMMY